jgi:predicted SAM-dependent methyltransferase
LARLHAHGKLGGTLAVLEFLVMLSSLKSLAKQIASPVWKRVWLRVERRVQPIENKMSLHSSRIDDFETRIAGSETRIAELDAGLRLAQNGTSKIEQSFESRIQSHETTLRQHVPSFSNAVSSVSALAYELAAMRHDLTEANKAIGEIRQRLEFVRKEIMFEISFGRRDSAMAAETATQILSPEKLAAAKTSGIKLNLGCGHIPLDSYLNVDQRNLPGIDIVSDAGALPFEKHTVKEIHSAHLLEHFPQERLCRLLPYWRSLLAPGGSFRAVVPDGDAMIAGMLDGSYPFEEFREVLFGTQEYNGDFHFNLLTPASLTKLLTEAGFKDVQVPVRARRNGLCFEFEIIAARD